MKRQVFKDYQQGQSFLLPPDINEMIPEGHLVRVVNRMIDGIDRGLPEAQYKGGGTSAYDPQMLLKVIIYAYTQRIYTSRQIAKALRENLSFMWLSGMNRPDFRTINRFRAKVMKAVIDEVFYGIIKELLEMGMIDLQSYFVDGAQDRSEREQIQFCMAKKHPNAEREAAGKSESLVGTDRRA